MWAETGFFRAGPGRGGGRGVGWASASGSGGSDRGAGRTGRPRLSLHSSARRVKVEREIPSRWPAWMAVVRPNHQSSASSSKVSGMGIRLGPKLTPRALAAAIPSAWRWRMNSRSVWAT